uniref:Uncharacterized protein n=1 Tax=Anopheles albimanus TaxID=7167 RepID=A0A182FY92_ANOAL
MLGRPLLPSTTAANNSSLSEEQKMCQKARTDAGDLLRWRDRCSPTNSMPSASFTAICLNCGSHCNWCTKRCDRMQVCARSWSSSCFAWRSMLVSKAAS